MVFYTGILPRPVASKINKKSLYLVTLQIQDGRQHKPEVSKMPKLPPWWTKSGPICAMFHKIFYFFSVWEWKGTNGAFFWKNNFFVDWTLSWCPWAIWHRNANLENQFLDFGPSMGDQKVHKIKKCLLYLIAPLLLNKPTKFGVIVSTRRVRRKCFVASLQTCAAER